MNVMNNGEHPDHHDDRPEGDRPAGVPAAASGDEVADEQVDAALDQHIDVLVRGAAGRLGAAVAEANEQGRLTIDLPTGVTGSSMSLAGGPSTGDVMVVGHDRQAPRDGVRDVGAYEIVVEEGGDAPFPEHDSSVIMLGRGPRQRGEKGGRRRTLLTAAAVTVILALVGAGVWQLRGGGDGESSGTVASDPEPRYLVAGDLPEGFEPIAADDDLSIAGTQEGTSVESHVAAYGDPAADEPWSGPLLVVLRHEAGSPEWWEGTPSRFDDRLERETLPLGERVWEVSVEPQSSELGDVFEALNTEGAVRFEVIGFGVERETLLDAAQHVRGPLVVDPAGLPEGFDELARGPLNLVLPSSVGAGSSFTGLSVTYSDSDRESLHTDSATIDVVTLPELNERAVPLARLQNALAYADPAHPADAEVWDVEVRGQPAIAMSSSRPAEYWEPPDVANGALATGRLPEDEWPLVRRFSIHWFDPELDAIVIVTTSNMDEEQAMAVVDGLREAEPGEGDALVRDLPPTEYLGAARDARIDSRQEAPIPAGDDNEPSETVASVPEPPDVDEIPVIDLTALDEADPVFVLEGEAGGLPWSLRHYDHDEGPLLFFEQGPETNSREGTILVDFDAQPGGFAQAGRVSGGSDRQVPVYGYVPPDADAVVLTSADGDSHSLDLHPIEGVDAQLFMGWAPFTDGSGVVRALDGAGDTLAGWPQAVPLDRDFGG